MYDINGCTCYAVRALGEMPVGWLCVSCRGREKGAAEGRKCRRCGVGLLKGEGEDDYMNRHPGVCSRCYYDS